MALSVKKPELRENLVAYWIVPLRNGIHTVEFEHGSTSGKRVLRVDGQEILRKEWMFKLVGDIKFPIGNEDVSCELRVDPMADFSFKYSLYVDNKPLKQFVEQQNKSLNSWWVLLDGKRYRISLDRETLEVWINGELVETEDDFTVLGTEMKFILNQTKAVIKTSSVQKKDGVLYQLYINDKLILEEL